MRVLFWGSRNATVQWLPVMRGIACHAALDHSGLPPFDAELLKRIMAGDLAVWPFLPGSEPLVGIHGAGPAGGPESIGADKLFEVAMFDEWPKRRTIRRCPPKAAPDASQEEWGRAAKERDAAMVALRPHRAYAIHTDMDASRGSSMTASFLTSAGIQHWYVRVKQSGELVSVEMR